MTTQAPIANHDSPPFVCCPPFSSSFPFSQEFDMGEDEALTEAVDQFKLMGVDLTGISQ